MKYLYSTLFVALFCLLNVYAQEGKWKTYTNKDNVNCILIDNDKVWIGSKAGVLVRDTSGKVLYEFNKSDGLLNDSVYAIAIDGEGNKWFGTQEGVSVYDGNSWQSYTYLNSGLHFGAIRSIAIDKLGNKWFASQSGGISDGVSVLSNGVWTKYNQFNSNLKAINFTAIQIDSLNNKWVSSGSGVFKFNDTLWTKFDFSNTNYGLYFGQIHSIGIDPLGKIYFGTDKNVSQFDGKKWVGLEIFDTFLSKNSPVLAVAIDKYGNKWFGSEYFGLAKFNTETTYFLRELSGLGIGAIRSISIDQNNNKWIGTSNGVYKLSDTTLTLFMHADHGLASNQVYSIAIDNLNSIFVGHNRGKISKIADNNINTIYSNLNSENSVYSIATDQLGNVWAGTNNDGVVKLDKDNNATLYNGSNSPLNANDIASTFVDSKGNKWFGPRMNLSFLWKFADNNWTNYNSQNSNFITSGVLAINEDSKHNIWVATVKALYKVDDVNGIITKYTVPDHDDIYYWFTSIAIDKNDVIWCGSTIGVVRIDGNSVTLFNKSNSLLPENRVESIAIDASGNKWFGTWGKGVVKFDDNKWTNYTITNSYLTSNFIRTIKIDKQGNKWFGTLNGGISILLEDNPYMQTNTRFIKGKVFYDKNFNQVKDTNERFISNQLISLNNGKSFALTDNNGEYILEVDTGKSYVINFINRDNFILTKDTSYTFHLGSNNVQLPDFGVFAPEKVLFSSNLSSYNNRCSEKNVYLATVTNLGTTENEVSLSIQFDKDIIIENIVPSYDSVVNNKAYFSFNDFKIGASKQVKINVKNPDFNRMGDTLKNAINVSSNGKNFQEYFSRIITCAYDPNFKEVNPLPTGDKHYTLMNNDLNYTIYFQNTGNDTAYHVIIKDTLSKYLDYTTFRITGSSHHLTSTIDTSCGLSQFVFNNIMLPDSNVNEKASHGFFSYSIRHKTGIAEETLIKNTAYIYFDFNPAIVTNTTKNNLVTQLPQITNVLDEKFKNYYFKPNPLLLSSEIRFDKINTNTNLQVFDLSGHLILEKNTNDDYFILNRYEFVNQGLYFYKLSNNEISIFHKLVVE